jgi:predicted SAM-dependent methyltransferase
MNDKLKFSVDVIKDLIEIDIEFYQNNHEDLKRHSEQELYENYAQYGYREGRTCHKLSVRENFISIKNDVKTLEIGPFTNPVVAHDNVKYLDVMSSKELQKRAEKIGIPIGNIPHIHFVSKDGSLRLVEEKFDVIFSSHNLEHQLDIIKHLNEAHSILNQNGVYRMIVPNCAYCFDAYLPPSKISEIILTNKMHLETHRLAKVIEHRALTVHNDSLEHWKDILSGMQEYKRIDVDRVSASIQEFEAANGSYIDVHCWQFMPHTLSDILSSLIKLDLIKFKKVLCYGSVYGRNEFCIELIK